MIASRGFAGRRGASTGAVARRILTLGLGLASAVGGLGCSASDVLLRSANPLHDVQSWAMQLQGLNRPGSVERLVTAPFDMVVFEPTRSMRGQAEFPTSRIVGLMHRSRGTSRDAKLCIAYLNVGQAEDYRAYWKQEWRAPSTIAPGTPSFLVSVDPDGWSGNYPVAYWDPRWRKILFGLLDQVLDDGFDGVYMDWILAYAEPAVVACARRDGAQPARAMVDLLAAMRRYARARAPGFLFIAQNGVGLLHLDPGFILQIDGFAHEDLSFHGAAGDDWTDPKTGDHPAPPDGPLSTRELGRSLQTYERMGIPVFTIDYAQQPANVARARATSRALGFVPFVSRTPLDRLPSLEYP